MGIFIDYSFYAECPQAELLDRLRRLRQKAKRLPLVGVGKIRRLDPVYTGTHLEMLRRHGYRFPPAVGARLKGKLNREYRILCGEAHSWARFLVPKKFELKFLQPALDFMRTTDLWDEADLPEKIEDGQLTVFRKMFSLNLAEVMLHHGYLLALNPGDGSEWVRVGLTTFRGPGVPVWLGCSFTKTQYATHFTQAHENVCHVLDAAKEVGLLYRARDTCGYYKHRSWKKAAPIVNEETTFAFAMRGVIDAGIQAAQAAGIPIKDVSHPATKNYNLVHVDEDEDRG